MLLYVLHTQAQIVNIPDTNFKAMLIASGVDINNDGEIQELEASLITDLNVTDEYGLITDITGIKSFSNLLNLNLSYTQYALVVDISGMASLKSLNAFNAYLGLSSVNFNNCTNLQDVTLKAIIDTLYPTGLDSLKNIQLDFSKLNYLNFTNCKNLKSVGIANTSVKYADLSNLERLDNFGVGFTDSLEYLDLGGCSGLTYLNIHAGNLQQLNLLGCINLTNLTIWSHGSLDALDLSTCYKLENFYLYAGGLKKLNIKNGVESRLNQFELSLQAPFEICADEFEINTLKQYLLNFFPANLLEQMNINSYCTFFPGGNHNTIQGKSLLAGNNGTCDTTSRTLPNVLVKISDTSGYSSTRTTGTAGVFAHYPYKGLFTLTPYFPYPYFTVNPATASVAFDTANGLTATRDFCIQPTGIHNDLEISFLPTWPVARPGFNAAYTLVYKNRGTTTLSGNVTVNFDNNKMNFVSASENVTTLGSGQLLWNYSNLLPFESRTINVTFNLLPPPVNNIGDTINYLAVITPSDNDETAFDNIFILPQRVIGSFDPNDKQCIEGSNLDISKIGDYLHYQIRFQNEGTDTAFNIVIADTLSDNLDWNTFEYIGSSHTADVKLSNNKLEFFYSNINLPYKAIDEPGSNGWVAFKIKPKPSVVIGDSLNNSAAIYFDFNLPVVTNTATTIVSSAATPVPVKLEYFSVNKKENVNQLNWKTSCTYGNAAFVMERSDDGIHFKAIGNITATALRCQLPFNFTDNNPAAGKNYYRLKISDADGKNFYSKTLVVGNDKAGLEITAVAHNIVYLNSNKQQLITMSVVAADGRQVFKQKQTVGSGNNNISLQMENAAKGIYTLFVYTSEGDAITKRFIK